MDAYSTADWSAAFAAITGASAALAGLLFVALSINLSQVIKGPGLVGRAIEVLVLLTSVLIISTLLLMPAQPAGAVAVEVLSIGVLAEVMLASIHLRAPRRLLQVTRLNFTMRVVGAHVGPIFLILGSASLLAQNGGGLYWIVPAMVASMVAAIIGAWVMLVEIVR